MAENGVFDESSPIFPAVVGLTYSGASRQSFPFPPTVPPSTCISAITDMSVSDVGSGCPIWCCVGPMSRFSILSADVISADPTSVFYLSRFPVDLVSAVSFW